MAPLVSLQLSCISARSSAPPVCQTNSSKPKTLTMFLSKVKLHLDDARQYCLHEVKPKAIPFIILLRKVTSGLITWQPLGIIWKHARHWREFFCFFVLFPVTGPLMKSFQLHEETLIKKLWSWGRWRSHVCCFTATFHTVRTWSGLQPHVGRCWRDISPGGTKSLSCKTQASNVGESRLTCPKSSPSPKVCVLCPKQVTAPFPKCVAILAFLAMLVAWLCGCMDVSPSISSEISNNYWMDCQDIFPSRWMMIILVMGFYLSIIIIH